MYYLILSVQLSLVFAIFRACVVTKEEENRDKLYYSDIFIEFLSFIVFILYGIYSIIFAYRKLSAPGISG